MTANTSTANDEPLRVHDGSGAGEAIARHLSSAADVEAIDLRDRLVDALREKGVVTTKPVEAALRAVPRHSFVPDVPLGVAYADDIVRTKHDAAGAAISAASQPTIVAMMLEQVAVRPGDRILEIGAGTGYNAALLAHLTGVYGSITTIDVDADIVDAARTHLDAAGYPGVHVVLGDGALGYLAGGPYDSVVATVGTRDVPLAWQDQVSAGGRLVVPMRLRGSVSRSVVFQRYDDHWRATDSQMCSFMPLRGAIADDPQHLLALTRDGAITLELRQDQPLIDKPGLTRALTLPRVRQWTGCRWCRPPNHRSGCGCGSVAVCPTG